MGYGQQGENLRLLLQARPQYGIIRKVYRPFDEKRHLNGSGFFVHCCSDILNDPEIDVVIELMEDAAAAYQMVSSAIRHGKPVICTNVTMLAACLPELASLRERFQVPLLYGSVFSSCIPALHGIERKLHSRSQYLSFINDVHSNYVLDKIFEEELKPEDASINARVEGIIADSTSSGQEKLLLLLYHIYGMNVPPDELMCLQANRIHASDIEYARQRGLRIKLVAHIIEVANNKVLALMLPQFIEQGNILNNIRGASGGFLLQNELTQQFFSEEQKYSQYGIAPLIVQDMAVIGNGHRNASNQPKKESNLTFTNDFYLKVYVSFERWGQVCQQDFEWIDELHGSCKRCNLAGVIASKKLKETPWFTHPEVSIIATPDCIMENIEKRNLCKRSLQLAGSKLKEPVMDLMYTISPESLLKHISY